MVTGVVDGTANARSRDIRRYDEVPSTNEVAAALGRQGAPEGLVVTADHQTAGRGRRGRRWLAPPGTSLLVSVLLLPAPEPGYAHLPTLAMALAAAEACEDVAGVCPRLKWPNDVVVGERKLGGVLGEATTDAVVVGAGLNVNWGEQSPPPPGVSLDALVGHPVDRTALLDALLGHLDQRLAAPRDQLLADYRAASATLGRRVTVGLWAGTVAGEAVDLTAEGHLVVDDGRRRRVLTMGDVVHARLEGSGA